MDEDGGAGGGGGLNDDVVAGVDMEGAALGDEEAVLYFGTEEGTWLELSSITT